MLLKLAFRNLRKNLRRSILSSLAIAICVAGMVVMIGFGDGSHLQMIKAATQSLIGDAQIIHHKYQDEAELYNTLCGKELTEIYSILKNSPDVVAFSPRVATGALVSKKVPEPENPENLSAYEHMLSEGAYLLGVQPVSEKQVSKLPDTIVPDNPLDRCIAGCKAGLEFIYYKDTSVCDSVCKPESNPFDVHCQETCTQDDVKPCISACRTLCHGKCSKDDPLCDEQTCVEHCSQHCYPARFLSAEDPNPDNLHRGEAVVGFKLAKVLDLHVGDSIVVTTGTLTGRTYGAILRVVGLVKTDNSLINRSFVLMHYSKLAKALEIPKCTTAVVVKTSDLENADDISNNLNEKIREVSKYGVMKSWRQLVPELDIFVKLDQGSLLIALVLLTMIVGVIVSNLITMSAMERLKEYGVRMALGEKPRHIAATVCLEAILLATFASTVGLILGEPINYYFQLHGIDIGIEKMEVAGVVLTHRIYTLVTLYGALFSALSVIFFSFLGSLYPAWKIAKMTPTQALAEG